MSCWVVPTLAAEYWKMPVDEVLKRIRQGSVKSKIEHGFVFVDVAPQSPQFLPQHSTAPAQTPLTYVVLTREELTALEEEPLPGQALAEDEELPADEESALPRPALGSSGWLETRQRVAHSRRAPQRRVA